MCTLTFFEFLLICIISACVSKEVAFHIENEADGKAVRSEEGFKLSLKGSTESSDIVLRVESPFYDNLPPPNGVSSQPYFSLWDYEVIEAFFLNDQKEYLEVEIGPNGEHIVLLLKGERNIIHHSLPLKVKTNIQGRRWTGEAVIPGDFFPPQVSKFNAYAIHDMIGKRRYLALYPSDGSTKEVDFHNLNFFQPIDWASINPLQSKNNAYSEIWEWALKETNH